MSQAKVLLDSINEYGNRLTTMEVKMHRYVLAEFNTHRAFSRNGASSRAIPVEKQIKAVLENPALPPSWGKNQKGMQAEVDLNPDEQQMSLNTWLIARDNAVSSAQKLLEIGVHKQITNRLLEPWMWYTAIVSFTEFPNFEEQRCSPLASPEMQAVAYAMQSALKESTPQLHTEGGWHLPLIQEDEWGINLNVLQKISVARCARVSYLTHDGKRDIQEDIKMYDKLHYAVPPHKSPFEHVAKAHTDGSGNFKGWMQFRHIVFES
jgi:thymidylate synthase ThyX